MTSKREDIIASVATLLATAAGVSGRVYRSRVDPVRIEETPAIIIEQIDDRPDFVNLPYIDWDLQFRVVIITRGEEPDKLADPVISDVYAKLMADRGLGGKVMDIVPVSISFRMAEGDSPACNTELIFTTKHRTLASSLET